MQLLFRLIRRNLYKQSITPINWCHTRILTQSLPSPSWIYNVFSLDTQLSRDRFAKKPPCSPAAILSLVAPGYAYCYKHHGKMSACKRGRYTCVPFVFCYTKPWCSCWVWCFVFVSLDRSDCCRVDIWSSFVWRGRIGMLLCRRGEGGVRKRL